MNEKRLYRNNRNSILLGVCQGLGEYFGVDAWIFRLIALVLLFSGGGGLIVYLLLGILLPSKTQLINEGELIDDGE